MKIKAIIVAEGEIEDTIEFGTISEFDAFSRGLSWGAELYAGCCSIYREEDVVDLEESGLESWKRLAKELRKEFKK